MTTNTKKVRPVKLRRGPTILVSEQIFTWRKKRKERKAKATVDTLYNEPGCPTIDEQASDRATPNWNLFK